jgi:hypothetical protein
MFEKLKINVSIKNNFIITNSILKLLEFYYTYSNNIVQSDTS